MKVSDEELLAAIWREQVRTTARGCVDHYVGGRKGLCGESSQHYAQDIHIVSRERLGVPLSKGQLRKRLVRLIEGGKAQWSVGDCTFWLNNDKAKEVFSYARAWWTDRGVPSGFDEETRGMRCVTIEGFDDLAIQLAEELLGKFGELPVPSTN